MLWNADSQKTVRSHIGTREYFLLHSLIDIESSIFYSLVNTNFFLYGGINYGKKYITRDRS